MAKVGLFSKELQETAVVFKALGHPARLAILKFLADTNTCICGDISNELPLSRTTVNQHLKELKDLNLIRGDIEGVKTNYCLNKEVLKHVKDTLDSFLNDVKCCG